MFFHIVVALNASTDRRRSGPSTGAGPTKGLQKGLKIVPSVR